jgi:GNAT superfamily N-acetyltransferase
MLIRLAQLDDIGGMHRVRLGVLENVLHDHSLVTLDDYRLMLETRGRGWVYERDGQIRAFGVADQAARNIWALFVAPGFENQGIGRTLLSTMVDWLCKQGGEPIWLTTEPHTRAERFYRTAGWREAGITSTGEIRFELHPTVSEPQSN